MQGIGSDRIAVSYHGIAHTHLDSLAHINESGVFYNGYTPDQAAVVANRHAKNSIHNVKNGIFTRGVLIDIPRLKGVPYLEPGTPIYVEDLEAWEKQAGVKVSAGDALFVRTGVWARRKALGPWLRGRAEGGRSAGLDPLRHSVAEAARRRPARQRSPAVRVAVGPPGRRARFRARAPRRAPAGQLRPRGARRGRRRTAALGLSPHRRPARDSRRHGVAGQPGGDILKVQSSKWKVEKGSSESSQVEK